MRRILWQMDDSQLWQLRIKAHDTLHELYYEYTTYLGLERETRAAYEETSPHSAKRQELRLELWEFTSRIEQLEQKIAAQRTFVRSVDDEYLIRNPPFWTREDRERIEQWRRHS